MSAVHWVVQAAADVPADDGWLAPGERARLAGLRFAKRRADWRLGRWTAKRAVVARLAAAGPAPALTAVEIRAAPDGAPQVLVDGSPVPLAISLSHRAGLAVCAVAPGGVALGCDLEPVEPRSPTFVADWFTAEERQAVEHAPAAERALLVTLLWCAKESVLKALRTGLRLDTRSVTVDPPPLGPERRWRPLTVRHPAGRRAFVGWWRLEAARVVTVVAAPPAAPPVRIPTGWRPGRAPARPRPSPSAPTPARHTGQVEHRPAEEETMPAASTDPRPHEVEVALAIRSEWPGAVASAICRLRAVGPYRILPRPDQHLRDRYLDTPERSLGQRRVALRLREVDGAPRLTLKADARRREGRGSERLELEAPWSTGALDVVLDELRGRGIALPAPPTGPLGEPMDALARRGLEVIQEWSASSSTRAVSGRTASSAARRTASRCCCSTAT